MTVVYCAYCGVGQTPEEKCYHCKNLLLIPSLPDCRNKRAIESKEFLENYDIGVLHSECEELKDIKVESEKTMKYFAKLVLEHHKVCKKGQSK